MTKVMILKIPEFLEAIRKYHDEYEYSDSSDFYFKYASVYSWLIFKNLIIQSREVEVPKELWVGANDLQNALPTILKSPFENFIYWSDSKEDVA